MSALHSLLNNSKTLLQSHFFLVVVIPCVLLVAVVFAILILLLLLLVSEKVNRIGFHGCRMLVPGTADAHLCILKIDSMLRFLMLLHQVLSLIASGHTPYGCH